MIKDSTSYLDNFNNLKKSLVAYIKGDISYTDLKHTTAPFGIYKQRDDKFMVRIRITGGELATSKLNFIVEIAEKYSAEYLHLTTRQDIQLHGICSGNIFSIVSECNNNGIPFKGGGGDTFRNIAACPDSGLSLESVFDVTPYAKLLTEYFYNYDKVYDLPRKLKIAFSCSNEDKALAKFQDLGFIARVKNKEKGFAVYVAGGMGRDSMAGIKVFDFIPEYQFVNCAVAIANLFYDHGNRNDRTKARIRYLAKDLGENKFVELFMKYFDQTTSLASGYGLRAAAKRDSSVFVRACPCRSVFNRDLMPDLSEWKKYAVQDTIFDDIALVKLFIPYGKMNCAEAKNFINITSSLGIPFLRLTRNQNICIPVKKSTIPMLFQKLSILKDTVDLTASSMKGLITSCVGAKVCGIGIIDTLPFADSIASELDKYFCKNPEKKCHLLLEIISSLKLSGCHNSCSNHPAAKLGLQGIRKKNKDGIMVDYCKVFKRINSINDNEICTLNSDEIGKFITNILRDCS